MAQAAQVVHLSRQRLLVPPTLRLGPCRWVDLLDTPTEGYERQTAEIRSTQSGARMAHGEMQV